MLTAVAVKNAAGSTLNLPLFNNDGYYEVYDIDGLGPIKADINLMDYAQIDGGIFLSARGAARNIVLTLGLRPDFVTKDVATLRRDIYDYLPVKEKVTLSFTDTVLPDLSIDGYVESVTPGIFSKDTSIQISIICDDPYFKTVAETTINGTTGTPAVIVNNGKVPVGFSLVVSSLAYNQTSLTVSNIPTTGPAESITFSGFPNFGTPGVTGTITVVTRARERSAIATSVGNLIGYGVGLFPKLQPGSNSFNPTTPGGNRSWQLKYRQGYTGL